ncbi:MAG: adenine-specific DNA-methyltransferase [Frankiaceae bacterium]|nr:adenine-specific DNA-methyltransferase [Frankiaceae bacterium]
MKRAVEREQFFTGRELARRCVDFADRLLRFETFARFVEPSAGDGSFLDLLPADRRIGIDIDPRAPGVVAADFLTWRPPAAPGRVLTIGNPPFGQRAVLAVDFVEAACVFSDAVAFILPRSFNKYTFANRVPRDFALLGSFDCDEFRAVDGRPRTVKAVFQVWQRGTEPRPLLLPPATHPHFGMRHCHLSRATPAELDRLRGAYEFAVAQVGSDFAPRDAHAVTRGSHWFIAPAVADVRRRFERLDFAFLDGMNTAHKSLSKRDIVAAYQAVLDAEAGPGLWPTR